MLKAATKETPTFNPPEPYGARSEPPSDIKIADVVNQMKNKKPTERNSIHRSVQNVYRHQLIGLTSYSTPYGDARCFRTIAVRSSCFPFTRRVAKRFVRTTEVSVGSISPRRLSVYYFLIVLQLRKIATLNQTRG